jgi:spore coat protein U-like protein
MSFRPKMFFVAAALLAASGAHAQTQTLTATIDVTAKVAKSCTFSAQPISLGTYNAIDGSVAKGQGDVTVQCTKNTPYSIALDSGTHASGNRRMQRFASNETIDQSTMSEYLEYVLYSDQGLSTEWTTAAPVTGKTTHNTQVDTHTVYAKAPAFQDVAEGNYRDTVTATLNF